MPNRFYYLLLTIGVVSLLSFCGNNKTIGTLSIPMEKIVDSLETLGYFRYTDPGNVDTLKKELLNGLKEDYYLSTIYKEEKPYNSYDYRHYGFDGETLYEQGGFIEKFEEMQTLFKKMNISMKVDSHSEDWNSDKKWLNHRITINGKEYIVFKNFSSGYGWGEAAQRFAEIVNDQLVLQKSDERLFLENAGNDGNAVFLTQKQFELLNLVFKDPINRPLDVKEWCKVMEVDPKNYIQNENRKNKL